MSHGDGFGVFVCAFICGLVAAMWLIADPLQARVCAIEDQLKIPHQITKGLRYTGCFEGGKR